MQSGDGSKRAPVSVFSAADLDDIAQSISTPSEGQAAAGNYRKGHANWQGLQLAIETPKGGTRSGTDANGSTWEVSMPARPLIYQGRDPGAIKRAMQRTNARWMLAEAGVDEKEIVRLMRHENNRVLTATVNELEAKGGRRITSRTFRSFMATRVRAVPGIRVDREQRQLWLGHLGQDTTAHYEIADQEYLREAAAATDEIIRLIDQHSTRTLWPKARDA